MRGTMTLMHGNDKVCQCKFDNTGYLQTNGITQIYNEVLLPVCIGGNNPSLDLKRWLMARNLAPTRQDIAPLREFYGSPAFMTAHGVSLFDSYWFADANFQDWERINPYDNWVCKDDSVILMLNNPSLLTEITYDSPNLTLPGSEPRLWYRNTEGDFCLLYSKAQQEMTKYRLAGMDSPYVAKRENCFLNGNSNGGQLYCKVTMPTSKNVEMIPLEEFYNVTFDTSLSNFENLKNCCDRFDIPRWKTFLQAMIDYDEKCNFEDRQLADVGVLRDTHTLELIGFAQL